MSSGGIRADAWLPVSSSAQLHAAARMSIISLGGKMADFERAWAITDSVYPYFHFKHFDWDSIHAEYEPHARSSKGASP